jgi:hypothetical protein
MLGKQMLVMYLSLGLGYMICVIAKKQEGVVKTLGYTLGIAMIVLTLVSGVMESRIITAKICRQAPGISADLVMPQHPAAKR